MRAPGFWENGRAIASMSSQLLCVLAPAAMATVMADNMALYWSGVIIIVSPERPGVEHNRLRLTVLHGRIDILHWEVHAIPFDFPIFAYLSEGAGCR